MEENLIMEENPMRYRSSILGFVCLLALLLVSPGLAAEPESPAPAVEQPALELELFSTEPAADEPGLCLTPPPMQSSTCVPPDGCAHTCSTDKDCNAVCCGVNFGRCVTGCAPKPAIKRCICLS